MKTKFLFIALALSCGALRGEPLAESVFTDVVNDVNVVAQSTHASKAAKVQDNFKTPDLVRTGPNSRAELTAADQTITRVGANTVFSFEPAGRNMRLEKGSVLFHSPTGKGGGTIKSGGAAAAVLGTTIIVVATENGGFKVIVLEGKGKVTLPNGKISNLKAGQLIFVLPGQTVFGPKLDINLGKLVGGSQLVSGFSAPLSSLPLINDAINQQNKQLVNGRAEDTGLTADSFGNRIGNGMNAFDGNSYKAFIIPLYRLFFNQDRQQVITPPKP